MDDSSACALLYVSHITVRPPRWRGGGSPRHTDSSSMKKSTDRAAAEKDVGIDFENPLARCAGNADVFESERLIN